MPTLTVRNLPPETHRALKLRAAGNGRSTEAEIRDILSAAAFPVDRIKVGTELAALGRQFGGLDLDITRDEAPARVASFD